MQKVQILQFKKREEYTKRSFLSHRLVLCVAQVDIELKTTISSSMFMGKEKKKAQPCLIGIANNYGCMAIKPIWPRGTCRLYQEEARYWLQFGA